VESQWFTPCPELILPGNVLKKLVLMNKACSSEQIVNRFLPEWQGRHQYAKKIVELAKESAEVLKPDGQAKIKALKEQKKEAKEAANTAEEQRQARLLARYSREYPTKRTQKGHSRKKKVAELQRHNCSKARQAKVASEKGKGRLKKNARTSSPAISDNGLSSQSPPYTPSQLVPVAAVNVVEGAGSSGKTMLNPQPLTPRPTKSQLGNPTDSLHKGQSAKKKRRGRPKKNASSATIDTSNNGVPLPSTIQWRLVSENPR
jgi:hypothetical protein